jgi:hypothetical protein
MGEGVEGVGAGLVDLGAGDVVLILAVSLIVASLTRLLIVWIALKGVEAPHKPKVIQALALLFKSDLQLGPIKRRRSREDDSNDSA